MITKDSLLSEAGTMGLPLSKKRAILREYLQTLMLNSLYKHKLGNKIFFMGGTALRFFYKIPRFSEDLDFNTERLSSVEFDALLNYLGTILHNEGFNVKIQRKDIYNVFSARIGFNSVMKQYDMSDQLGEDMVIKLEAYNPEWAITHEAKAFSAFGMIFTALLMDKGSLLAEKSHAFIHRCRGRDVYDVLFLLRLKFPLDKKMFAAKGIKGNPKTVLADKFAELNTAKLKMLSKQLLPFLFKSDEIELLEKASFYGKELLNDYR